MAMFVLWIHPNCIIKLLRGFRFDFCTVKDDNCIWKILFEASWHQFLVLFLCKPPYIIFCEIIKHCHDMLKNCGHKSGIETKCDCYHSICIIGFALVKENHQLIFLRQYMATLKEIQKSIISKQLTFVGNKKSNK